VSFKQGFEKTAIMKSAGIVDLGAKALWGLAKGTGKLAVKSQGGGLLGAAGVLGTLSDVGSQARTQSRKMQLAREGL
jgi:hypothetical protein